VLDVWSLGLLKSIALFRSVIAVHIYCCASASHKRLLGFFFLSFFFWRCGPMPDMASSVLEVDDSHYLTTHDSHKRQNSIPPEGF